MRFSKLGSRFLRVVSADGTVRYYSSSGISSFRLFWIFRNFSSLDDRILNTRQLHFIKNVCRTVESQTKTVDPADVLGTLELSRSDSDKWSAPAASRVEPVRYAALVAENQTSRVRQPFAVSAIVLAVCVSTLAAGVMNSGVRLQVSGVVSELRTFAKSLLPRQPQQRTDARQLSTGQQSGNEPALQPTAPGVPSIDPGIMASPQLPAMARTNTLYSDGADSDGIVSIQKAALRAQSLTSSVLPFSNAIASSSSLPKAKPSPVVLRRQPSPAVSTSIVSPPSSLSSASTIKEPTVRRQQLMEPLPASGPPLVHPVPDLSPVSRDTQVVLRAVVLPDGKVADVTVIEGNPRLAREAAHAVSSWRYSPRPVTENAESRILLRVSPDVVTVSFPEPGTEIARR